MFQYVFGFRLKPLMSKKFIFLGFVNYTRSEKHVYPNQIKQHYIMIEIYDCYNN